MLRKMSPAVPLEISRPDALNVMRSRVTVSFGAPGNLFECASDILRSTASICVAYRASARDSTLRACLPIASDCSTGVVTLKGYSMEATTVQLRDPSLRAVNRRGILARCFSCWTRLPTAALARDAARVTLT